MVVQLTDEDVATAPVSQVDGLRMPRGWPLFRGVGLVLAAQTVLVGWFIAHSWFFVDDFIFIREGKDSKLTLAYLRSALFEHFSPNLRLAYWVLAHSVGPSWPVAVVLLVGLTLVCTVAFAYVVSAITRRSTLIVGTTFLYAVSLFFVRNAEWWTGGVHHMSVTLFSLLTIGGYIRWHQSRRRRSLVLSLSSLALALLTHEDALILLGVLVLLRLLILPPHPRSLRQAAASLVSEWRVWLVYTVLTAVAFWNFFTWYYFKTPRSSISQFLHYMWMASAEGFFATLCLVKVPEAMIHSTRLTGMLVLGIIVAFIGTTCIMRIGAWRGWLFFGVAFVVAIIPLGVSRVARFGVTIGREPGYQMGPAYLFLFALVVVLDAPARHQAVHRVRPTIHAQRGSHVVVACLLLISYSGLYIRGARALSHANQNAPVTRAYFTNLRLDVKTLRKQGIDPALFDGLVPDNIMPAIFFPFNRYDLTVRLMLPSIRLDTPDAAYLIGNNGRLQHVRAYQRFSLLLSSAAPASVAGWTPRDGGTCLAPPALGGQVRIDPPHPIEGNQLVLRVDYRSAGMVNATFAVDGRTRTVPLGSAGTVYSYVEGPSVSTVSIDVAGPLACLERVSVEELVPDIG